MHVPIPSTHDLSGAIVDNKNTTQLLDDSKKITMIERDFLTENCVDVSELARWVSGGLQDSTFQEHTGAYLASCADNKVTGCALGAAFVGKIGDAHEALMIFSRHRRAGGDAYAFFATHLDISIAEAKEIDRRHSNGVSARDVFESFRSQGAPHGSLDLKLF